MNGVSKTNFIKALAAFEKIADQTGRTGCELARNSRSMLQREWGQFPG